MSIERTGVRVPLRAMIQLATDSPRATVNTGLIQYLIAWILFAVGSCGASAEQRPNILMIVVDDLGYGELGCYGWKEIPTPHLDALAASGVRFSSGYVTAPFCAASRAALLTGLYQTRFGFEFNPIGASNASPGVGLPVDQKTVADRLRDSGYATALIGKWHLGGTAPFHPQRRGFDEFFGFLHEGHYYVPLPWQGVTTWLRRKSLPNGGKGRWISPNGKIIWSTHLGTHEHPYDADNPILRGGQPIDEPANLTDAFTREACSFIQRSQSQPFFLYVAYNAVHSPMQASDAYMAKFAYIEDVHRRIFAAMLAHLDDSVGEVLKQLDGSGLKQNTLVIFLSDNGGPTKELTSSNAPLRGGKGELWEGGIRVPFIVSWPTQIPSGRVVDNPVLSIDATVTALAVAGLSPLDTLKQQPIPLDGISLLPMLNGQRGEATAEQSTTTDRSLFWRVGKRAAMRNGDWKLLRDGKDWQLYDLAKDIGETTDLAEQEPGRVQQLSSLWGDWNAQQIEPLWK